MIRHTTRFNWMIASLVLMLTVLGTGAAEVHAESGQGWGTLKAFYYDSNTNLRERPPAVLYHPVYGFGFTVQPGIFGGHVDQLCEYMANQTAVDLYDVEHARFVFGSSPGEYVVVMVDSDGLSHGAAVDYNSGQIIEYFQMVTEASTSVLYVGAGSEVARQVGEETIHNPDKFIMKYLCRIAFEVLWVTAGLVDGTTSPEIVQQLQLWTAVYSHVCS